MEFGKKVLEQKIIELISSRDGLRKSYRKAKRKKDEMFEDILGRWVSEATANIKSLRKAIKKLAE